MQVPWPLLQGWTSSAHCWQILMVSRDPFWEMISMILVMTTVDLGFWIACRGLTSSALTEGAIVVPDHILYINMFCFRILFRSIFCVVMKM